MALKKMKSAAPKDASPKTVGVWLRVSTEDQARGESPVHHEKRARHYAEARGWKIAEVYHLEGVSGKTVLEHPEAKRMMADVKAKHITGLIFSKLARLARSTRELLDISDFFREEDADLVSLEEAIDTSSASGRLFYTMIAAMAQWEREEIGARVAASVPVRAKMGKPLGGQAPFGYRWHDRKLVPDAKEAPIRKRMYELFLEHKRVGTVASMLNKAGHRTRNGSVFGKTTVKRLLSDPTAKGLHRLNYTTARNGEVEFKPEEEWVLQPVDPIVSTELWDECNSILEEREKQPKPVPRRAVHLFSGVTICVCGQRMYARSNSPKYVCQKCLNKIPVNDLEEVFREQLKAFLFSPTEVAKSFESTDGIMRDRQAELTAAEKEVADLERHMSGVMRLHLEGKISDVGFASEYEPSQKRLTQLKDRIPELLGELDFLKIQRLSSEEVVSEAQDLSRRWPRLDHEEKRRIIEEITDKIVVGKDEVAINLVYLPSSSKIMTTRDQNLCR